MNAKIIDAGYSETNGGYGLTVELDGEQWFIPTDAATCSALWERLEAHYGR